MEVMKKCFMLLCLILGMSICFHTDVVNAAFQPRLSAPSESDRRYYSNENPYFYVAGASNCTNYVYGRAWEILGTKPNLVFGDNAGAWWEINKKENRYPYGSTPKLGAIACWGKSGSTLGHVAVVESISGSSLTLSEAWYKSRPFNLFYREASNMEYKSNLYGAYYFQGYIYITDNASVNTNPDSYPFPTRDLYYTNPTFKGNDVKWVQAVLNYLGYSVAIDGSYGPDCADKIASFQRDNGLSQDGKCGPATREKLKAVYEAKKNPPSSHETNPPVISDVKIYDVDSAGYTISCKATDESGVGTVRFPTWTEANGQDDLDLKWWDADSKCIGTKNGDTWTFRVKDSDHNYERGDYTTHIYAYDMHGIHNEPVEVNGTISNSFQPSATVTWNNRQYELYEDILSWSEARNKCEELGGTLVAITSEEEQNAVNSLLKNPARYWYSIGGVKAGNEFIWITGEKMDYTYWGVGEPNNNGGDEYHMSVYKSGTWNDSSDWVSKGFILERKLPEKTEEQKPGDSQGGTSNQPQNPSNQGQSGGNGGQSGNSSQGGTENTPNQNGNGSGNQTTTPGTGNTSTEVTGGTDQQPAPDITKPSTGDDTAKPSTNTNTATSNRTVKSTAKSVTIAWKSDRNAVSGYRIYVKSGRKYVKVGTTKAGTTRFTIKKIKGKSLKPGTTYTVRIASLKKISGKLKEVKKITFKTATKPSAPSIYYGKKKSSAKAVVKWRRVSGVSGYEIQMSTRSKKGFKKIATTKASKSSLTKTRLKKGRTYYFRIRAYKNVTGGKVYSSWSRVKKVK